MTDALEGAAEQERMWCILMERTCSEMLKMFGFDGVGRRCRCLKGGLEVVDLDFCLLAATIVVGLP